MTPDVLRKGERERGGERKRERERGGERKREREFRVFRHVYK